MKKLWGSNDMGEGPNAVQWLVGDFLGQGRDYILQCWNYGSRMGMFIYGWDGSAISKIWQSSDVGQGSNAVAWLVGKMAIRRKHNVVQCFDNGGQLGIIIYAWDEVAKKMETLWTSSNVGHGSSAVKWLIGDITGGGTDKIIQCCNNNGQLSFIVYQWNGKSLDAKTFSPKEGSGAVTWHLGRIMGKKQPQIVQGYRSDKDHLGLILYDWQNDTIAPVDVNIDMKQGYQAIQWLYTDVTGKGFDDILQLWNNGYLACIQYGYNPITDKIEQIWSSSNLDQYTPAIKWITGKITGGPANEIVKIYTGAQNTLAMLVYHWKL